MNIYIFKSIYLPGTPSGYNKVPSSSISISIIGPSFFYIEQRKYKVRKQTLINCLKSQF